MSTARETSLAKWPGIGSDVARSPDFTIRRHPNLRSLPRLHHRPSLREVAASSICSEGAEGRSRMRSGRAAVERTANERGTKLNRCSILLIALGIFVAGCDDPPLAPTYEADFYECGEEQTLFVCAVGTGPPRDDCEANGSGSTTTEPITC